MPGNDDKKTGLVKYSRLLSPSGFTLTEVLIVIALMAILTGIALPSFNEWRQNLYYKQAASEIADSLKTARSKAITLNQQHGVKFVTADKSYQFGKYSTNKWVFYGSKGYLSSHVILNIDGATSATATEPNISFNVNGASFNNYSVCIKDAKNSSKYTIAVERSGRIRMKKVQ